MPDRPSAADLAARLRGAATAPAPPSEPEPAASPPPAVATARTGRAKSKYTLLFDQDEAADFEELAASLRRRLGRRVDQSEIVRALLRMARRDVQVLTALMVELSQPRKV